MELSKCDLTSCFSTRHIFERPKREPLDILGSFSFVKIHREGANSVTWELYILAELHADLFSLHTSPLKVYAFVPVDDGDEYFLVRRDFSWPTCAASRLVCDSTIILEPFMHVYVRTTYDQISPSTRTIKKHALEVMPRDGRVKHVCKRSGSTSKKLRGYLNFCVKSTLVLYC